MLLAVAANEIEKYGVFAAMFAVASMIVAAVGGLGLLWRGPIRGWELPEEPMFANKLVSLPTAFVIILGFFYATPQTEWIVLIVGGLLAFISASFGIRYVGMRMRYKRFKEVVAGNQLTEKVWVLAGDELTPWAKATIEKNKITEQECFGRTPNKPYDPDHMWPRESRIRVFKRMMWVFVITLFCGTGCLAWLACAVEVKVTGKAASEILSPSQIPTGKQDSNSIVAH